MGPLWIVKICIFSALCLDAAGRCVLPPGSSADKSFVPDYLQARTMIIDLSDEKEDEPFVSDKLHARTPGISCSADRPFVASDLRFGTSGTKFLHPETEAYKEYFKSDRKINRNDTANRCRFIYNNVNGEYTYKCDW